MRIPLKPNWQGFPAPFRRLLPRAADPRDIGARALSADAFEQAISRFKVDGTWKTTWSARHRLTDALLLERCAPDEATRILDIGASCGSTSLDLIGQLGARFARYYVTDLIMTLPCHRSGGAVYYYHPLERRCIMRASDLVVAYADVDAALPGLGALATHLIAKAPPLDAAGVGIADMMRPDLRALAEKDPRVDLREYDCLSPWPLESVDVIKTANVLNSVSFTEDQIARATANLARALRPRGHLLVTYNHGIERVSCFERDDDGRLRCVASLNGGTDVERVLRDRHIDATADAVEVS
ncbi:MAG: methyltransferase domain-containing protein [Lautropia sp.]